MTDAPIDMAPFFARHDRATRRILAVTLTVSLGVSAAGFGYAAGAAKPVGPGLWVLMVLIPIFVIAFRTALLRWGGKRAQRPDGTLPMNPSDARSARRVANAGAVFVAGIGMAMIASQASAALSYFDAFEGLGSTGEWFGRAGLAGMGALMIYFGNAWPMMPTAREPGPGPAAQKAFHRLYGWTVVVAGLFVLAALALPGRPMPAAVAAVSLALVLAVAALIVRLLRATRARSAT